MKPTRPTTWRNWGRNLSANVVHFCEVETVADIQHVVRRARAEGVKVRVVGDAHSWSPLAVVSDYLISTAKMDRILAVSVDPPRITVEPGVTVGQTLAAYARHGVVLPTNVDIPTITVAGAVAVGANGFSQRWGTYSEFVEEIELVDGTGEVRVVNRQRVPDLMRAVACSLGLFGVTTKITLNLQPMANVRVVNRRVDMREAISEVGTAFAAHDEVQYFWFPFNDTLMLQVTDTTTEPVTRKRRHEIGKWCTGWMQAGATHLVDPVLRALPRITPAFTRQAFRSLPESDQVMAQSSNVLLGNWIDSMRGCQNCSVSFPPGEALEPVQRAWWIAVELLDAMRAEGQYPANLEMNMRLFGPCTSLLCSLPGEAGPTCNIQITGFHNKDWPEFQSRLMQAWMAIPGARPHWAKEFQDVPGIVGQIRSVFGGHFTQFVTLWENEGNDPDRVFVNDFLDRLFFQPH